MGTISRRLVKVLALLWLSLSPTLFANNEKIFTNGLISFDKSKLVVNEAIEVTLSFPIRYDSNYKLIIPKETFRQPNMKLLSRPQLHVVSDLEKGDIMEFKFIVIFYEEGAFNFPTFELSLDKYYGETKPFTLHIKNKNLNKLDNLAYLEWNIDKENILEGEFFLLTLEVKRLNEPKIIDSVNLPNMPDFLVEKTEIQGSIKENRHGSKVLYDIPIASWMVAAQNSGMLTIPSVSVKIDNDFEKRSDPLEIEVERAPWNDRLYTIGDFNVSATLNETKPIKSDSSFSIKLRVEGSGNLNSLSLENPIFDNTLVELLATEKNKFFKPSKNGYNGYYEIIYKFKNITDISSEITIPEILFYSPTKKRFDSYPSKTFKVDTLPNKTTLQSINFLKPEEIISIYDYDIRNYAYFFIVFIIAIIIQWPVKQKEKKAYLKYFAIMPVFLIKLLWPSTIPEPLSVAQNQINKQNYYGAINYLKESLIFLPHHQSAIHYNISMAYFLIGEKGESIYHLRKAILFNPLEKTYQKQLEALETENEISISIPANSNYPIFMRIITLITLILFTLNILMKNKPIRATLFYLAITSMALFSILLVYKIFHHDDYIVLSAEKKIYRIPEEKSTLINTLKEGSSFIIKGDNSQYNLLFSQTGAEGWIDSKNILYVDKKRSK